MKILHINCTDKGSVGKIINEVNTRLKLYNDIGIVCHSLGGVTNISENNYKTAGIIEPRINTYISKIIGIPYGFAYISTFRTKQIINDVKPDIVHLHCPNNDLNIYSILNYLKINGYATVITNHCEMFYTGNCAYSFDCIKWQSGCGNCPNEEYKKKYLFDNTKFSWNLLYNSIKNFEKLLVVSVSKWVYERSQMSPILGKYKNIIIENGIDVQKYRIQNFNKELFLKKYRLPINKKLILFVTAHFSLEPNDIKGGYFLKILAEELINDKYHFIVIGNKSQNLKYISSNISIIGRIDNEDELVKFYNIADLSIVLSKKETFSMTCAESLCCGTPIIGFKAGGPETISLKQYSEFTEYGNINKLKEIIIQWINKKNYINKCISCMAHNRYDSSLMFERYYNEYKEMINN